MEPEPASIIVSRDLKTANLLSLERELNGAVIWPDWEEILVRWCMVYLRFELKLIDKDSVEMPRVSIVMSIGIQIVALMSM